MIVREPNGREEALRAGVRPADVAAGAVGTAGAVAAEPHGRLRFIRARSPAAAQIFRPRVALGAGIDVGHAKAPLVMNGEIGRPP